MHYIDSVTIDGFRGSNSKIELSLKPGANFLIGLNGTGKTTLIKLVNAVLNVDIEYLAEQSFDNIEIKFASNIGSNKNIKPKIELSTKEREGELIRTYAFYEKSTDPKNKSISFNFNSNNPRSYRQLYIEERHQELYRMNNLRRTRRSSLQRVTSRISEIFNCSWLSIDRQDLGSGEREHDSSVDEKIYEVNSNLSDYFSILERKSKDELESFQKDWFLSFLASDTSFTTSEISKIDFQEETYQLEEIFANFNINNEDFKKRLKRHEASFESSRSEYLDTKVLDVKMALSIADTLRIHTHVENWLSLIEKQAKIFEPRTSFIDMVSSLLYRKSISTNSANRIEVINDDGDEIYLNELSSGEKQLTIFLGETVLQKKGYHIFLADEPELSLHVEWQEKLVENILELNPNSQIFFATHSPDIVGSFQDGVIRMESLL